jgi:hypothetical protein
MWKSIAHALRAARRVCRLERHENPEDDDAERGNQQQIFHHARHRSSLIDERHYCFVL